MLDISPGHRKVQYPRVRSALAELIAADCTGLMVPFLLQAVANFARELVEVDPAQITENTNGFIAGEDWFACASAVLAAEKKLWRRS